METFILLIGNRNTIDRKVLNYINTNAAYFLIASIVKKYFYFGHHAAYLYPEFELGNNYAVDYLVVGKNSDGYHFLFIELEAVYKRIVTLKGEPGDAMRKGLEQIDDWKAWIESNYSSFTQTLKKYVNPNKKMKDEFYIYDSSRMHYALVVGRRENYKNER